MEFDKNRIRLWRSFGISIFLPNCFSKMKVSNIVFVTAQNSVGSNVATHLCYFPERVLCCIKHEVPSEYQQRRPEKTIWDHGKVVEFLS